MCKRWRNMFVENRLDLSSHITNLHILDAATPSPRRQRLDTEVLRVLDKGHAIESVAQLLMNR